MNNKNFDYLRNQIRYTGFRENLDAPLREKIESAVPEFRMAHKEYFGNDVVSVTLYFRKSDQSDLYFFNKYDLIVVSKYREPTPRQSFRIYKDHNFTLKEAYNLVCGRSVNKNLVNRDGAPYNAWVQLNFEQHDNQGNFRLKYYHHHYGYDLASELEKYPLIELETLAEKSRLMASLLKGNRQTATMIRGEFAQICFLEASPRFKSLKIYDENHQRINNRTVMKKKEPDPDPPIPAEPVILEYPKEHPQEDTTPVTEKEKPEKEKKRKKPAAPRPDKRVSDNASTG